MYILSEGPRWHWETLCTGHQSVTGWHRQTASHTCSQSTSPAFCALGRKPQTRPSTHFPTELWTVSLVITSGRDVIWEVNSVELPEQFWYLATFPWWWMFVFMSQNEDVWNKTLVLDSSVHYRDFPACLVPLMVRSVDLLTSSVCLRSCPGGSEAQSRLMSQCLKFLSRVFPTQTTSRMKKTTPRLWTNLAATSSAGITLTWERHSSSSHPSPRSCLPYWRTWWV